MSDKETLNIISQKFYELHTKISTLFEEFGLFPLRNSIAERELAISDRKTILSAYSHGHFLIEAVANNLSAFTREISEPIVQYAIAPNIRVVLESASICIWLLKEDITISERINRYLVLRCSGLEQLKKWADATKDLEEIKHAEKRLSEAKQQAKEIGIIKINKELKKIDFTYMVKNELNEEANYRLLSAMTHANNWALLRQGIIVGPDAPYGKLIQRTLDIELIKKFALIGLNAFQKQVVCKSKLFGWPVERIEKVFNKTRESLPKVINP